MLKERIAEQICIWITGVSDGWMGLPEEYKEYYREKATQILTAIAEAAGEGMPLLTSPNAKFEEWDAGWDSGAEAQRQSDINQLWKWAKGEGTTRLPTKEEIERDMRACAEAAFKAGLTPKQAAGCVPSGELKCPNCPFKKQAKGE